MTTIELSINDGIAVLRFNRPEVLNAINEPMVGEIEQALDSVEQDDEIRALILTGTGRAFCVGSDLKERTGDPVARVSRMHRLILRLVEFNKLRVATFNGLALGGGLEIGMACMFRVVAPEARMGLPEITHSLMPAYGGTQLLPRLVGVGRALELALSGDLIDARRAMEIGLVTAVDDDPFAASVALADRCFRGSATARQQIKRAILGGVGLPLAEGLALEAKGAARVGKTAEALNGISSFAAGH